MRRIVVLLLTMALGLTALVTAPPATAMGPDNPAIGIATTATGASFIVDIGQLNLTNIEISDGATVLYDGPADTYQIAFGVPFDTYVIGQQLDVVVTEVGGAITSWTETITAPGGLPSRVTMQAELDAAEALFAATSQDYLVTFTRSCFCLPGGPIRVQVANGQVLQVITTPGQPDPGQGKSVADFFLIIEDAIARAAAIGVTYDATTGHPTHIQIDYVFIVADDEIAYQITDLVSADDPSLQPCLSQTITALGTSGDDTMQGTAGNDVIISFDGNDVVFGLDGDDIICTGDGKDRVIGGSGDDVVHAGAGNDVVRGQVGNDTISGGLGNDRLYGGIGSDVIDGGDGADVVSGFGGADTLTGGAGGDIMFGGFGADQIDGGDGNDRILGLVGKDTIDGGADDDHLSGNKGADIINGGDGDDTIFGGGSNDTLAGDAGNDTLSGGSADDTLSGGADTDACYGNGGTDTADATCETTGSIP